MRCLLLLVVLFPFVSASSALGSEPSESNSRKIDFVKDIQPILRKNCYSCHGAEEQESGLRLDIKRRAFEGGDGGVAIVAKQSSKSRLLEMVAGTNEEVGIMPPEGEGTPLTKEQVALIRAWIDQGASWPDSADLAGRASDHWSFQVVRRPALPKIKDAAWVRNAIDHFILARLEKENIRPSPEVERAPLIRRLYLDLLGLPPTPKEVNDFVNDPRNDAYDRVIEQVLKSQHYGERWGRHWLDLARYADSDGYEKDRPRPHAWRYRQWVIDALNADMPFDEFSIQQIAGDMLPKATTEQLVAVGFHRNTLHNTEGGTDKEEDRVKKTIDRTNTFGTTWLGMTVGCAQCHSHKYDPLTQREYYSLYAFFNYIAEKDVPAPLVADRESIEKAKVAWAAEDAKLKAAVADYENKKLAAAQANWETTALAGGTVWTTLAPSEMKSAKGAALKKQNDNSVLVTGKNEQSDIYTITGRLTIAKLTAIRLEVLPDKTLTKGGPGRASNGNFVLTTLRATITPSKGDPVTLKFKNARADFSQKDWQVTKAINDDPKDGWAVSPEFGKRHVAAFDVQNPVAIDSEAVLTVVLDQTYHGNGAHNIGKFRLAITSAEGAITLDGLPANVAKALATKTDQRTKQQQEAITAYFRTIDAGLAKLNGAVAAHAKKAPQANSKTMAQSVTQQAGSTRETRVFPRGNFLRKSEGVRVVSRLPDLFPAPKSLDKVAQRLDLARWLFDPANPLTARVTVNRMWQRYFGKGLVATSDDFGTQGQPPTHPLLLDWLASELRESGWNMKHVHRLIVSSSTYRQSSAWRRDLQEIDPENQLLARQWRGRVEAEIVRDLALAVSGLLDKRIGGPSVRPPQPAEYSKLTYANSAKWAESKGGDRYRRGMYTFFQRTSPYPMLMTFDSPDSNTCTARRSQSNTPLQALTIWNDVVFFECAQNLARRIVNEAPGTGDARATDRQRAIYAFQLCVARRPDSEEVDVVLELLDEQRKLSQADEKAAAAIIGNKPIPKDTSAVELSAWVAVGRTLINLDEFITRE